MTYRATLVVDRQHLPPNHKDRRGTITTRVAGCQDADDARRKLRELYRVLEFKKLEPVDE